MNEIRRAKVEVIEDILSSVRGMLDDLAKEEGEAQYKCNYAQGVPDSDMRHAVKHLEKTIQYLIAARTDNRPSDAWWDTRFLGRKEIEGELVDMTDPNTIYQLFQMGNDAEA